MTESQSMKRVLDLYCGAGGAGMGYARAGCDVVGVDIVYQPHYPFSFIQDDAITYLKRYGDMFDIIHASPPCQAFTTLRALQKGKSYPDLLTPTREILGLTGIPFVIENVLGAPLRRDLLLCGTMFGLGFMDHDLRRHRIFEISGFNAIQPNCNHTGITMGIYGFTLTSAGESVPLYHWYGASKLSVAREAMDIDWMTWEELTQAIPPAYTQYIFQNYYANNEH